MTTGCTFNLQQKQKNDIWRVRGSTKCKFRETCDISTRGVCRMSDSKWRELRRSQANQLLLSCLPFSLQPTSHLIFEVRVCSTPSLYPFDARRPIGCHMPEKGNVEETSSGVSHSLSSVRLHGVCFTSGGYQEAMKWVSVGNSNLFSTTVVSG